MKRLFFGICVLALLTAGGVALAEHDASVTGLLDFQPGQKARADEVNHNFHHLENEANNQFQQLEEGMAGKQDILTGSCQTGDVVVGFDNGTPLCAPDQTGGTADDLNCLGCVDNADIAADAGISVDKIAGEAGLAFSQFGTRYDESKSLLFSHYPGSTEVTIEQVSVTAPPGQGGNVLVTGSAIMQWWVSSMKANEAFVYDINTVEGSAVNLWPPFAPSNRYYMLGRYATISDETVPLFTQEVFPIAPGETLTFDFDINYRDGEFVGRIHSRSLTAIFFPTSYQTQQ